MTTPLLDIIMLVHDKANWADIAIRAVEHNTKNTHRLIVVDMASREPATKKLMADLKARGHTIVTLAENRSFSHGVNMGVMAGDAKFIALLNDDAIVQEGWDSVMLQDASDKFTGLVGARSNYVLGAQGDPGFVGEPPFLAFVCVAMRRAVWEAVGPMDSETFDGFSSEDLDYSWRVKKAGLKLKVSNTMVLHAGSKTLAATAGDAEARQRNDLKYAERLIAKWGKEWYAEHTKLVQKTLVVSYHAEEWTRVAFAASFVNMRHHGGYPFTFINQVRTPIHLARQVVADHALDSGFDVLVQFDDDATFPPDVLKQLLAPGKDVLTALAYQRRPPHLPCIYSIGDDGMMGTPLVDYEHTGIRQVGVSGYHCSMMKTSVIKKMRDGIKDADGKVVVPGTRQYYGGFENKVGEDFAFSLNLKKYGIPLYCNTDLISGHIGAPIVVDEAYMKQLNTDAELRAALKK